MILDQHHTLTLPSFRQRVLVDHIENHVLCQLLEEVMKLLTVSPTHNNDLKYWSLMILHTICVSDRFHSVAELNMPTNGDQSLASLHDILHNRVPGVLGRTIRLTFGNSTMQKHALHSLVRVLGMLGDEEVKCILISIEKNGILGVLVGGLKSGVCYHRCISQK